MEKIIKKKDYTKKELHKKSIIYYTYKKIYGKILYRKKDDTKDRIRLYKKELYKRKTELYK